MPQIRGAKQWSRQTPQANGYTEETKNCELRFWNFDKELQKNLISFKSTVRIEILDEVKPKWLLDCQCQSRNGPGFGSSILRHRGIWGTVYEAVLNKVL
jgi:hypothetical protein